VASVSMGAQQPLLNGIYDGGGRGAGSANLGISRISVKDIGEKLAGTCNACDN
jgi:hypothetical protein